MTVLVVDINAFLDGFRLWEETGNRKAAGKKGTGA